MAILALGLAGAGLTSAIGIGASAGWLGGVLLGNLLFGGGKGQNIEGPRIDDLSVQTSTYGAPIPLLYGTMRISGNVIWSTPLKETRNVKKSSGGKGGGKKSSQTTYSYSVSFAVGLCVGPVSTVRRIWADTKLIYDAASSNTQAMERYPGVVRIYTGDENQLPDSTIEMALGVGNVPAYRGRCILVLTDLQLADFANRIPNISAEVVGAGGLRCEAVILPPLEDMFREGGWVDPARGVLIGQGANHIFKYDLVNNRLLLNVAVPSYHLYGTLCGIDSRGYYYHAADILGVGMTLVKRHPDSLAIVAQTPVNVPFSPGGAVRRDKLFCHYSRRVYNSDLVEIADLSAVFPSHGAPGSPLCDDPFGNYWQVDSSEIRRYDGKLTEWTVSAWTGGESPRALFWDDTTGHLYFTLGLAGRIVKWHPDDGFAGYVDGVAIPAGSGIQSDGNMPVHGKLWAAAGVTATLIDLVPMRLEKTVDLAPFLPVTATHFGGCYEKLTHSVVIMTDAGQIKYPLERYGADTVPLAHVLSDICQKAGMVPTNIVTSAVSQPLRGYVVSRRMAAREALEPLLGSFFIDAVETDGVLRFIPRGGSSVASIGKDDLGADDSGGTDSQTRLSETRVQDVELPQRLDIVHVDPTRDHQPNTQHASRITDAIITREKQTREISISLTPDEAKQIAERTLYNAWVERNQYTFSLPPKWLRLDPSDVVTVNIDDVSLKLRLNKVDFGGNNVVSCEAVAEDEIVYLSTATGSGGNLPPKPIGLAGPTPLFLMDLPMLRYEDDTLGMYYAFGFRDGSVTGASMYRSPDELAWEVLGTGNDGPSFGWAATVLPNVASPWTWDETSKVQVALTQGSLDSKTALEVLNWANVALLGDEIIQWRNANVLASGIYELSGLLRGRRGTESAMTSHATGERFILLTHDGVYRAPLPMTEINRTAYYKGIPDGGNWDDAPSNPFVFNGNSLRCFSPVQVAGTRDGSGNLTVTWKRRTRWYGEWQDGTEVPLFEASENYEIDILSVTTVKRTLTANTPSIVYPAAEQVVDFGAAQSAVTVAVYQLNAVVGRGQPQQATI
ncbi:MAG: phage tail protein [Alphaproteobacteria bacterium]|nr:MAG: phage tail protein [Alphaproteobacteria bacterium]